MAVGAQDTQVGDSIGVVGQPRGPGVLESSLQYMPVSRLDESRSNGQAEPDRPRVIQTVGTVGQIAMAVAHVRVLFRSSLRLQMLAQRLDHLGKRSAFEPFLLGSSPGVWSVRSTRRSRTP